MSTPTTTNLKVRENIVDLQKKYDAGDKKPLENLMKAWKYIKELPAEDPRSFFTLGGYHGEPFRGAGAHNSAFWGGYCNHGNILFPTWHRMYLVKLEEALQSAPDCQEVMLPFWDEASDESLKQGIPWAFTRKDFVLDGQTISNPLRSFQFPKNIKDDINGDSPNYSKPEGYETVRYPLSGLVGTAADRAATAKHNALFPDDATNVALLNKNVVSWLNSDVIAGGAAVQGGKVFQQFNDCLDAPNFTVFSNTTSAKHWNAEAASSAQVVPLESPHNSIHLSVGGFEVPGFDASPIDGANADMGENDTAGLDPIFYFHHCFVDRVFWLWQKKHGFTDRLEIIEDYPGTNSNDDQGPTPGVPPNSRLTLASPLDPFKMENDAQRAYTSLDCINIETQLGFTYGPGSLEGAPAPALAAAALGTKVVHVAGINRAAIRGSFLVSVFANHGGRKVLVGTEAVLSRWSVKSCANCQTHLEVKASFPLTQAHERLLGAAAASAEIYEVEIQTRDGEIKAERPPSGGPRAELSSTEPLGSSRPKQTARVEVR